MTVRRLAGQIPAPRQDVDQLPPLAGVLIGTALSVPFWICLGWITATCGGLAWIRDLAWW